MFCITNQINTGAYSRITHYYNKRYQYLKKYFHNLTLFLIGVTISKIILLEDLGVILLHMADALISPTVGGVMWATSAGMAAYASRQVQKDLDERKVPLMGVLGAFIFAAQMINFAIPGTGSSGHISGGLILAILLGPYAGFLTIASVLTIQALFFADGGLLSLGCNIFNLGFYGCFIVYPLIYKQLVKAKLSPWRILIGSTLAAIIALQLGAVSVVLETLFSRNSELPFKTFLILMQPIHLAIGIVEGLVTTRCDYLCLASPS